MYAISASESQPDLSIEWELDEVTLVDAVAQLPMRTMRAVDSGEATVVVTVETLAVIQ